MGCFLSFLSFSLSWSSQCQIDTVLDFDAGLRGKGGEKEERDRRAKRSTAYFYWYGTSFSKLWMYCPTDPWTRWEGDLGCSPPTPGVENPRITLQLVLSICTSAPLDSTNQGSGIMYYCSAQLLKKVHVWVDLQSRPTLFKGQLSIDMWHMCMYVYVIYAQFISRH